MTLVVGTAGHIDHGKTALLRALTGMDADRLPEERRRGMTIDVGYAHLALGDGTELDFVDVPGHDRLVGNMLVGAGEIDAALLVVAADDGPRPQTLEHLELLDALGVAQGIAVVTKADLLAPGGARRAELTAVCESLLAPTTLAGSPVLVVSAVSGEGLADLRAALVSLRDRVDSAGSRDVPAARGFRLAVDRAFTVHGRGPVVTGSLRGLPLEAGRMARVEPDGPEVRIREVQVHGRAVERAAAGRTALNLAGVDATALRRGLVVTDDPAVEPTDRLMVVLRRPARLGRAVRDRGGEPGTEAWPPSGSLRLHLGTDQAGAMVDRAGHRLASGGAEEVIVRLRLDRRVAARPGDRVVLRRPSPPATVAGGRILDVDPPAGPSRRRATTERLVALRAAAGDPIGPASAGHAPAGPATDLAAALLDLHGALASLRWTALGGVSRPPFGPLVLAEDVLDALASTALDEVVAHHAAEPASAGLPLVEARRLVARELRRRAAVDPADARAAGSAVVDRLVATGRLGRTGDRLRAPDRPAAIPPALSAAMDRLEAVLAVPAPPAFQAAVRAAGCPPEGVRALEASGRIVRLEPDLAYAARTYRELEALAVRMAAAGPLSPAAFRDATGTSRRFALAILEDLDRRGVLRRTPEGHRPGPRAPLRPSEPPS